MLSTPSESVLIYFGFCLFISRSFRQHTATTTGHVQLHSDATSKAKQILFPFYFFVSSRTAEDVVSWSGSGIAEHVLVRIESFVATSVEEGDGKGNLGKNGFAKVA